MAWRLAQYGVITNDAVYGPYLGSKQNTSSAIDAGNFEPFQIHSTQLYFNVNSGQFS